MKNSSAGLSILAGGLAFVGSAGATDLIVNGSFEDGPGVGWVGDFGTYNYSAAYFAGPPIPDSENPGSVYSWRHGISSSDFSGPLTQSVDLSAGASFADIDAGRGAYQLSAWLASYTLQPDSPYVTVQFFDASQNQVGGLAALDRTSGVNFITFADGVTTFDRTTHEHYWAKYLKGGLIPIGARTAIVGVTHSPNSTFVGRPDTYTDLVKLDVSAVAYVPPSIVSAAPAGPNNRADAVVTVVFEDGSAQVDPQQIQMTFDGVAVTPNVQRQGTDTIVTYDPPGLLAPESTHSARVIAVDNALAPTRLTNDLSFSVISYYNLVLPAPLSLETFDTTAEGSLPTGWLGVSYSAVPDPNIDLGDLNSAAYTNFTVVDSARFNSPLLSYNTHTPTDDYKRVLSVNPINVLNGAVVDHLAQNKICFGDSGYRDGGYQVLYLYSPDFDVSTKTNIYLVFNSIWEQNQDSIGAIEYSIDQGATWLPLSYYLNGASIVRDGDGNIDAVATLSRVSTTGAENIASYIDPVDQTVHGGFYGAFIGVTSDRWAGLGPYISARVDDDPVESKRIEVFRLPAADKQSKVRLRFAHAGTDSWYFGLDNVGLYSLTTVTPPVIHGPTPATFTEAAGNSANFNVSLLGVGPFTYRWQRNGTDLAGQTNSSLVLTNLKNTDTGDYSVVIGYVGGSVSSTPGHLDVFDAPPSLVLGQWDFNSLDLSATCGLDLQYFDDAVELGTGFLDGDFFGLPKLDGQDVNVMSFPGTIQTLISGGYKMRHGLSGTGGGTNVNQYTLIFDILYPAGSSNVRRTLLQTDPSNVADGALRIDENNSIGVSGVYSGKIDPDTWYRIALAVDLVGPGPNPIVAKFINGKKVGQQVLTEGRDGRWSLSASPAAPYALILGDNDVDAQPGYVSSIQLRSGRLSDAAIIAMGGPSATKIPGAVCALVQAGHTVIRWSGSVLESADELNGPYSPVVSAANPYQIPTPLAAKKFYRAR